ncbi:amidohydrolase family protein [Pigmentiphaga sp.]|uniref:amidohydrolase family protein n=1 Tax=Pigmentiphaga sp. TaxID=1977564 RepID=UPI0025F51205|nr:amidohydrolase family protein [Pigmentiphaga sp.]MBX6319566.1 amidohydrolase [Pigmentiphaga sp.]
MSASRIDVHAHSLPPCFKEAVVAAGRGPTITSGFPSWSPEQALELMDRHDIQTSILSVSQPGVHFGDDAQARELARACNEFHAEVVARWPRRFGAFVTVPLPNVDDACTEIDYALSTLGADGVCLLASYGERFLGDAYFDPVMDVLNDREAVVFIHPNFHPSSRNLTLGWPGWMAEFLFDTTRAAMNLVFSGALQRFPRIKFILAHAGGTLPYIAWRQSMAPFIDPRFADLTPEEILRRIGTFYFDTAISAGPATLGALTEIAPQDHILFGSDWPYAPAEVTARTVDALTTSPRLDAPAQAAIARNNALALFPRLRDHHA